jgi:hypothetical protein
VSSVTAVAADAPYVTAPGPDRTGALAAPATHPDQSGSVDEDRSEAVASSRAAVRSWPLLVLAVPAAAEVWSGWVGIARLTGFGMVAPLPGIWPSLHLDTSIALPVGVEAYAAYALRAWLAAGSLRDQHRRLRLPGAEDPARQPRHLPAAVAGTLG